MNGYIYVGGNTNNAIARTKDDGKTWNVLYSNESLKQVTSININNRGNIFAANVGVEGLVASFDDGNSWKMLNMPQPFRPIHNIISFGNDSLYASYNDGNGLYVVYSYNCGSTWKVSTIDANLTSNISDIEVDNNGNVYVITENYNLSSLNGLVYRSIDGAKTWELLWECNFGETTNILQNIEVNSFGDIFVNSGTLGGASGSTFVKYVDSTNFQLLITDYNNGDASVFTIDDYDAIYLIPNYGDGIIFSFDRCKNFTEVIDEKNHLLYYLTYSKNGYVYGFSGYYGQRIVKSKKTSEQLLSNEIQDISVGNISISPNPAHNTLYVHLPDILVDIIINIKIYDATGVLVYNRKEPISSSRISVDVSNLPKGIYIVSINGNDSKSKFVKY